ncbi:MAG: 4-(cytidine 5'-diphospho)-2-C-methyl-D-erythritol kinase [Pseudomonadota bacterium]
MAERVTRAARAKVNLTLHVTGQRADGYHLLDSLVVFADVADVVTVTPSDDLSLRVTGPMAEGVPTNTRNLAMQAAQLMGASVHIDLDKHLPHAAGIGGGSADAAATLLAIAECCDLPVPETPEVLGADVPVCLSPKALRMRGVGEILDPVPALPEVWAVLVNPGVAVDTPPVFAALTQKDNAAMPDRIPAWHSAEELAQWCARMRNDLEMPAISIAPVIREVLAALSPSLLARMSGSGATCFGLCKDEAAARALAADVKGTHPGWWVMPTRLGA